VRGERLDLLLREVVETLAPLDRTPCSAGEREAAEWLAARLRAIEGVSVTLEDEPSWGTFPPNATLIGLVGLAGAAAAFRGRRATAATLALACVAGLLDEAQNGPRILRRAIRRRKQTVNVVARTGDQEAIETLVILAHHDAPQTGLLFDQTLLRRAWERNPERLGRAKTPLPQWWAGLASPAGAILSALTRRREPAAAGLILGALATAAVADLWRGQTVQGANDNLSGVASLVALAEMLAAQRPAGLRVMLVSCGAEETLQDGIRAFLSRHGAALPPESTTFVNLDTVGSPHLIMLEAEGPIWMEHYTGPWLRDLVAVLAERLEIPLERGFRARASTDSVIPSRAGYPTATLVSITDWRAPANYHLPSDVPANLDYNTVAKATRLVESVVRELAARAAGDREAAGALRS
jgi:acetylornithine deacetylase/succinyl-diaminopimelate desuccinylase-like protein